MAKTFDVYLVKNLDNVNHYYLYTSLTVFMFTQNTLLENTKSDCFGQVTGYWYVLNILNNEVLKD